MGPAQRLSAGVVIAAMAAVGFVAGRTLLRPGAGVRQPLEFSHALHAEALECESCHLHVREGEHSGLPGLSVCLMCHDEPVSEEARDERIRELAGAGEEQVFRKLFRLPDNVHYSHRRHVEVAGIECVTCHGGIAESEEVPSEPLVLVTMDFCMDCHLDRDVPSDCTRCHR